jgi:hypothetical protein
MKHLHTFESFLNEAQASSSKHFWNGTKGWGLPGEFSYASTISFAGGKAPILIQPKVSEKGKMFDVKDIGKIVSLYHTSTITSGNHIKYKERKEVLDLVSGVKEVIKLIPSAWSEYDKLPENMKKVDGVVVEKLAPAKTVKVEIKATTRGKKYWEPEAEGEQDVVIEEIKKVFPQAYDINKYESWERPIDSHIRIVFTVNV